MSIHWEEQRSKILHWSIHFDLKDCGPIFYDHTIQNIICENLFLEVHPARN